MCYIFVMRLTRFICIVALTTTVTCAQAQTGNLIANGSFEDKGPNLNAIIQSRTGNVQNGYPYYNEQGQATGDIDLIPAGNKGITGWHIDSGNIDLIRGWPASDGHMSIDLNGSKPAAISQTIDTQPGTLYELRFDLSANPGGQDNVSRLRVIAGDKTKDFAIDRRTKDISYDDLKYETQSFKFRATDPQTRIIFVSLDNGKSYGGGWIVDNRMYPKNYFNRGQQVIGQMAGPVIDNVVAREALDTLEVRARSVPLSDTSKIWFHESDSSTEHIKIEESEN